MEPTRIYVKALLKLAAAVPIKGLAHITGGGLVGNLPRILPNGTKATLRKASWPRPEIFKWLQHAGNVAEDEMFRVFNCGIGMAVVVSAGDAQAAATLLKRDGELVYEIGRIEAASGEPQALIV